MIIEYRGKRPKIHETAFVAPTAVLIGDVEIGPEASIWFGTVLRGDNGPIRVGARTSVQDNSVIHVSEGSRTIIGDGCTIGHSVTMEDCTIGNGTLVGSNAVVLNDATIGEQALIGAGAVVASRATIPARVLAVGQPATVKRDLAADGIAMVEHGSHEYVQLSRSYLRHGIGDPEMHEIAEAKLAP